PGGGGFPGRGFPSGGGPLGGGPLSGGFPGGGGPPSGGFPGGGGGPPAGGLDNKLIRSPPDIFNGDRTKTKSFLSQWEIYRGVNAMSQVMVVPYSRAMFFFTYIKGELVDEWVANAAIWLQQQVLQNGRSMNDEYLWNEVRAGFLRKFENTMEQEDARTELRKGFKMGDNVDAYIAKFETLVQKARYDLNDDMVIEVFTDGLPVRLSDKIFSIDEPRTYDQWRHCVLKRQEKFKH